MLGAQCNDEDRVSENFVDQLLHIDLGWYLLLAILYCLELILNKDVGDPNGILLQNLKSTCCEGAREINVDDGNKDDSNGEEDDNEQISEEVQWNQSCIAIMERSTEFINAMELADKALFSHRYNKTNGSIAAHSNDTSNHHHVNHIIRLFMVMML